MFKLAGCALAILLFAGSEAGSARDYQPLHNSLHHNNQRHHHHRHRRDVEALPAIETDVNVTTSESGIDLLPDARWERFIAPGPMIVSLLGSLMVISTKADFSLEEAAPINGKFELIKNPQSFRATLVQISNDGWGAFNDAHTNMDKIQLYMAQVPRRVRSALKIIDRGTVRQIRRLLPIPLKHIGEMSTKSADLARQTHHSFANVMFLLNEVIQVTTTKHGMQDQELRALQVELNTTKTMVKHMDQYGKVLHDKMRKLETDVQRYQDQYEEALDDIPTGWDAIFKGLGHSFKGIVDGVGRMFGGGGGGGDFDVENGFSADNIDGGAARALVSSIMKGFRAEVQVMFDKLTGIFKSGSFRAEDNPLGFARNYKKVVVIKQEHVDGAQLPNGVAYKQQVQAVLSKGLGLCDDIVKAFQNPQEFPGNETTEKISALLVEVLKASEPFAQDVQTTANGPSRQSISGNPGDPFYNEKFKAQTSLDVLKQAQDRSDRMFKEYIQFQEKTAKLMGRIATLNFQEINYKEILEILREGIRILAEIKKQWAKLVMFFSQVSNKAEVTLKSAVEPFMKFTEEFQRLDTIEDADRSFYIDLLIDEAKDIETASYFLYVVSKTYVKISAEYIIPPLAGLPKILGVQGSTPQETDMLRQRMAADLERQSKESTRIIEELARKQREAYERAVEKRMATITENLNNYIAL